MADLHRVIPFPRSRPFRVPVPGAFPRSPTYRGGNRAARDVEEFGAGKRGEGASGRSWSSCSSSRIVGPRER